MSAELEQKRQPRDQGLAERVEILATVTRAEHCANFIRVGETFAFDLKGRVLPEKSTANLCLGMLARLQPALVMAADRASEGLHPISRGWQSFDCFDTGVDYGGMGKVCVRLSLRDAESGEEIPRGDPG